MFKKLTWKIMLQAAGTAFVGWLVVSLLFIALGG
jgi:hypothetical protein